MNNIEGVIEAIKDQPKVLTLSDGREVIVTDKDVQDLTGEKPIGSRIKQALCFADGDSFSQYVSKYRNDDTLLIADIKSRAVTAYLDYHGVHQPMAVDHIAKWQMELSEEFQAWASFERKLHDQADFIRFLEEYAIDIISPDPAKMMDLARDFEAIKRVNFKASKKLGNGDREFTYAEQTGTSDKIAVPEKLTLHIPIYHGEEAQNLEVLFRYRISDGGLKLGYDFNRIQPVIDASFRLAVSRVAEATGVTPFFGKSL